MDEKLSQFIATKASEMKKELSEEEKETMIAKAKQATSKISQAKDFIEQMLNDKNAIK